MSETLRRIAENPVALVSTVVSIALLLKIAINKMEGK